MEWQPALIPETASLTTLRKAAAHCKACPLYKSATQTVFGEGRKNAALMLLFEQPGDQEDLSGKPFIGPAGQVLNRALGEAGIDRNSVYVTNGQALQMDGVWETAHSPKTEVPRHRHLPSVAGSGIARR